MNTRWGGGVGQREDKGKRGGGMRIREKEGMGECKKVVARRARMDRCKG